MSVKPVKVAVIGSGNISYTYLNTLTSGMFSIIDVVGCSDLIPEKSKARADLFGIKQMTTEEILKDPEIEIVLNLTELYNHSAVTKMILEAGKHAYSEKAMGHDLETAKANYELAKSKGLRIGCAPDCYMGSAYQTARKLIDDGVIGKPLFAFAICIRSGMGFMASDQPGAAAFPGGPPAPPAPPPGAPPSMRGVAGTTMPYDMGGYYINVLVNLLGPVNRASGYSKVYTDRLFSNPKHSKFKQPFEPRENAGNTMLMGALEFDSGAYGNLALISEGFAPEIPRVEVFGTQGTLVCPDPNLFGGWGLDVHLTRIGNQGSFKMPMTHAFGDTDPSIPPKSGKREPCHNSNRGIAVADMAWAIRQNRPHRSSAELAFHTVEILHSIDSSCKDNKVYTMSVKPAQPAPLAAGFFGPIVESALEM
ncbi:MAG: Gfo/Idh/MocA family oxidoreductase [Treponema sp.]|nr:Gfo/Idh/MocA family oxidoreductase [Treponema sp.]